MDWLAENSSALQVLTSTVMALIWILYLQIFLTSFRRQRRPAILITLGAGVGLQARCFVTNLGLEPIYLFDLIVEIETSSGIHKVTITDRAEMTDEQLRNPREATNQGPLKSAEFADVGSLKDLADRAHSAGLEFRPDSDVHSMKIVAIVVTAASATMVRAFQNYDVRATEGRVDLVPTGFGINRIRGWTSRGLTGRAGGAT